MLRSISRSVVARRLLAPALLVPLLALAAHADVDVEVGAKAKVNGSFGESGGVEKFRFRVTSGTKVKATLKAKGKSSLDPGLRLMRGDDVVDLGDRLVDKGRKVLVKNPELANTDLYTLQVLGDASGDYLLKIVTKPRKSFKDTVNVGVDPVPFEFSAPPNSKVTLQVKASKSTGITPRLLSLGAIDLVGIGKEKATSHKATVEDVGAGGDMTLSIGSADGTAGPVTLLVKIKAPKATTTKLDVTAAALGSNNGGGLVFGKAIQPDVGGAVTIADDPLLSGTGIVVPADSLPSATVITIQTTQQIESDSSGQGQSAGPTIEFQPAGLQFAQDATVTLPFDPSQVPDGFDPQTALQVLIVEADGTEVLVSPTSVDVGNGLVTLPVAGFSKFTVLAPVGPPNLNDRRYWGVLMDIVHEPDPDDEGESGVRCGLVGLSQLDFAPSGDTYFVNSRERLLRFGMQRDGLDVPMGVFQPDFGDDFESGDWMLSQDGGTVVLNDGEFGDEGQLFVSRDGSILVHGVFESESPSDADPILDLWVERPTARQLESVEDLFPGAYHFAEFSLEVVQPDVTGGFVAPEVRRSLGSIVFFENGTARIEGTSATHRTEIDLDDVVTESFRETFAEDGTWVVDPTGDFGGSVVLSFQETVLRLLPDRRGRMFVGTSRDDLPGVLTTVIGVRTSTGFDRSSVRGPYSFGTYGIEPSVYSIQNGPGRTTEFADVDAYSDSGIIAFDGSKRPRLFFGYSIDVVRDPQFQSGLRITQGPGSQVGELVNFSAQSNGSIRLDSDSRFPGAMTPDRMFGFTILDPTEREDGFEVLFAIRRPDSPEFTEPVPGDF